MLSCVFHFFFFFSSRRRHTRFDCDWSSDVCSSDLFARDFDAAVPEFSNADRLHLEDARHPVLEDKLKRENRVIVPMSLSLGGEERVLVISGPNTGGKTVALKTVGVAALAAQAGIPVAAQRAILPIFDRVLVDIGDEQSIAADLSTFSAHMLNLKSMLDRL